MQLRHLDVGLRFEPSADLEKRVIGHVLPEHLLLVAKELRLLELVGPDHRLVQRLAPAAPAEQRELPSRLGPSRRQDRPRDQLVGVQKPLPLVAERVEGPRQDQALEHLLVQDACIHLRTEVGEGGERALGGARGDDLLDRARAHVPHRGEPVANVALVRREVEVRGVHVRRKHRDVHQAAGVQVVRLLVLVVLDAGEQRRHVLDRMVGLQVGGLVGDERVSAGVRGVEAVVRERHDEVEDLLCQRLLVAARNRAQHEGVAVRDQLLADLLAHRLSEQIGLTQRVARHAHRDLHHLLLVDDDPVAVTEDRLQVRVRVGHRSAAVLAVRVLHVHVLGERPGAVEGHERHQVLEAVRGQVADQRAHPRALQLEDPGGVRVAEHGVSGLIVQREVIDVDLLAPLPQDPRGVLDHRKVPQAEEVHLQQAKLLHPVHVELRHDAPRLVARVLGELQRQVLDQGAVPDHDPGGVDRVLAPEPLERPGGLDDLLRLRLALVGVPQLHRLHERLLDGGLAAEHRRRVHLAEAVPDTRRVAQDAGPVADPLLPLDGLERHDLRDMVGAVPLGDVADDLVAPALVEVHIDIGHLLALGVEEALEDQPVAQRVEVGDAEAVGDHRAGRRAASGPHADPVLPREADQVPDDHEVPGEAHRGDDRELVVQALADLGRDRPVATLGALVHELAQVRLEVLAFGRLEPRHVEDVFFVHECLLEVWDELDRLRDLQCGVACLRVVAKEVAHLLRGLDVELLGVELQPLRVGEELPLLLDAEQHVVRARVGLLRVVGVVRGHERQPEILRERDQPRRHRVLVGQIVVLELDVEGALGEDVAEGGGGLPRPVLAPILQHPADLGGEAAGEPDQALAVLGQQLLIDPRAVVKALEMRVGDQLQQVAVAGLVPGEDR